MKKKITKNCKPLFLVFIMGMLSLSTALAQGASPRTINGNIKDSQGEPIIGASVVVKGSATGTVTDFDGNFIINAAPNNTLVISYIGYKSQEIIVGNQQNLYITLRDDTELLNEIVNLSQ